jgi:hypothetical protein
MNERFILAAALILVGAIALWLLRRQSPASMPVLAVVISVLCGIFYPIASIWITPRSWRNISNLSENSILETQVDYLAFGLGLLAAIAAGSIIWRRVLAAAGPTPDAPARVVFRDTFTSWVLLLTGAALYGQYIRLVGVGTLISTEDFADKYLASRGLGVFLSGLNLMIAACLWAEASQVRKFTRWSMRCLGVTIIIWATAFIAVRTYAAALLVGYVVIYARERGFQLRHLRLRLVVLLIVGYIGMESYAILRSTWKTTGDLGSAIGMARAIETDDAFGAIVGGSEISHPFLTLAEIMEYEEPGALAGRSYLDAVLSFIPLFVWSERPQTLAQVYVAKYYPAVDERGGGSAFTFVGEAWWNFGHVLGPLVMGIFMGLALLYFHNRSYRLPHGIISRLLPSMTFLVLLFHRSQSSASFKQVMSIVMPCLLLAFSANLIWQAFIVRHSSPQLPGSPRPSTEVY